MPEMLDPEANSVAKLIRRAVIIGDGVTEAEDMSIGLVRALGFSNRHTIYHVRRPVQENKNWFLRLPFLINMKLYGLMRGLFGRLLMHTPSTNTETSSSSNDSQASSSSVLEEADAHKIAKNAREAFIEDGPLLVVASGQDIVSVASSIKKLAPDNVFVVQIQHPRCSFNMFDLVIIHQDDYCYPSSLPRWFTRHKPVPPNVCLIEGVLHQADPANRREAAILLHPRFQDLRLPCLVVNIGRPTKNCPYGEDLASQLTQRLRNVYGTCGSIIIHFSERTPKKISNFIRSEFREYPKFIISDGRDTSEPTLHMAHLHLADAFVITADSMKWLCEACRMGKPVYVIGAERCTSKLAKFQNRLQELNAAHPFTGEENMAEDRLFGILPDVVGRAGGEVVRALRKKGWAIYT
ncbi:mitochondrial fission protein ELM1-like isoform X2 [Neltuma alba]|uniref:mitochondrial fission protein ELM1-like isoform X2 n=1 Tax=Neltuma alba TaxID=207710 RepID=UPI0010A43C34|nr:mitochondrial fission protein ELM1-like isoform X2 [Prosopis alba]